MSTIVHDLIFFQLVNLKQQVPFLIKPRDPCYCSKPTGELDRWTGGHLSYLGFRVTDT